MAALTTPLPNDVTTRMEPPDLDDGAEWRLQLMPDQSTSTLICVG